MEESSAFELSDREVYEVAKLLAALEADDALWPEVRSVYERILVWMPTHLEDVLAWALADLERQESA